MTGPKVFGSPTSRSIPFENSNNGFLANDVQNAIEEARIFNPKFKSVLFEDFTGAVASFNYGWLSTASNGSSGIRALAGEQNRPGIVQIFEAQGLLQPTGASSINLNTSSILLGGGEAYYNVAVRVPTLSSGGNTFIVFVGLGDTLTGVEPVDGVYFVYDSSVSANWIVRSSNNSVRTSTTTSTAVAANTFYTLSALIDPTGTQVLFYIDNSLVATHIANIPTAVGRECGLQASIAQNSGTAESTLDIDYFEFSKEFTTPR